MRFGLFGGAVAKRGDETADSQGYRKFVDLVVEAESLGFHSIFLVEHHFSGSGQVSSSLNLLSYLAARTSTNVSPISFVAPSTSAVMPPRRLRK